MLGAEVVIVGSGAAAAHAAQTLAAGGIDVAMVDVGFQTEDPRVIPPHKSFLDLRTSDPNQHNYFLGPNLEAVSWRETSVGAQLTAARRFIIEGVDRLTPTELANFNPYESLALGGLGGGWGAGCFKFSEAEMELAGLPKEKMAAAYDTVIGRIGVSEPGPDIVKFTLGTTKGLQDPIQLSPPFLKILKSYEFSKAKFHRKGFYVGKPSLAILSRDMGERRAHEYLDMDFYSDEGRSVYRPKWTIENLIQSKKIKYHANKMVTYVEESTEGVIVHGINVGTGEPFAIKAKKVILAAGVFGTARIVLRSFPHLPSLPLLCNRYSYYPSLFLPASRMPVEAKNHSLAQLMVFHDPDGANANVATASVYGYRSLMLFRLIKEAPLSIRSARKLFQRLQKMLVIFGIHHPDSADGGERSMSLRASSESPTGDRLLIEFFPKESGAEKREREFKWAMKNLGCWPIKKVNPGFGSSIHYAGSLPFSKTEKPFHLNPDGRMHTTKHIYVADGSGIGFLPAKGVTLTLMALGDVTARSVIASLKGGG